MRFCTIVDRAAFQEFALTFEFGGEGPNDVGERPLQTDLGGGYPDVRGVPNLNGRFFAAGQEQLGNERITGLFCAGDDGQEGRQAALDALVAIFQSAFDHHVIRLDCFDIENIGHLGQIQKIRPPEGRPGPYHRRWPDDRPI